MASFHLQIVTPDGLAYNGQADLLIVRAIDGEVGILANHVDYVTALGMGEARITLNEEVKRAACIGGMLAVTNGEVKLVATTFEWADKIDVPRVEAALARTKDVIDHPDQHSDRELQLAEARIKRALVRQSVAKS